MNTEGLSTPNRVYSLDAVKLIDEIQKKKDFKFIKTILVLTKYFITLYFAPIPRAKIHRINFVIKDNGTFVILNINFKIYLSVSDVTFFVSFHSHPSSNIYLGSSLVQFSACSLIL